MPIAYYVIDSSIGPDDASFFDAFGDFIESLEALGLAFEIPANEESSTQLVQTWPILGRRGCVKVYDNYDTGIRHVELSGANAEVLSVLSREALARLPIQLHDDLLASYAAAPSPKALVKLTLSAPEAPGEAAVHAIQTALDDDDATLRRHAAFCMGLLAVEHFGRLLRARREVEMDESVSAMIDQALQFYS